MGTKHSHSHSKKRKGAAANYITRTQAIKRLQCSLADFRRLCILKGIFPREPRSRKKANSGSTAPASFYYSKDIQFLLHEPVLDTLRKHKTFAKKLSKAVGRGEWSLAKNLDESKPTYRLDHVIKERYPTFEEAIRDLDDALSLIFLFARLPASQTVQSSVIEQCSRLAAQWQLYVLRTNSLRKVFLSIKGIYFQAEIKGQPVTWLVPYQFTQHVPSDVDFRIMLTFIELYQTLLGFVFYTLYTEINLVYPPKLEKKQDEEANEIGALLIEELTQSLTLPAEIQNKKSDESKNEHSITARQVKQQIKSITKSQNKEDAGAEDGAEQGNETNTNNQENDDDAKMETTTEDEPLLFSKYYFYLSREVTRPTLEFVIRSFGGQVGWDATLGGGSPFKIDDPRITHFVVDRPIDIATSTSSSFRLPTAAKCAYVQPQWVVDCVNLKKFLPTEEYAPGKTLPPHLSPFVNTEEARRMGEYVPGEAISRQPGQEEEAENGDDDEDSDESEDVDMKEDEEEEEEEESEENTSTPSKSAKKSSSNAPALKQAARNPGDQALRHAAELEAESRGVAYVDFEAELARETEIAKKEGKIENKKSKKTLSKTAEEEQKMAKMMLTGKQKKLYNKMAYSRDRKTEEREKLEKKRKALDKARRK